MLLKFFWKPDSSGEINNLLLIINNLISVIIGQRFTKSCFIRTGGYSFFTRVKCFSQRLNIKSDPRAYKHPNIMYQRTTVRQSVGLFLFFSILKILLHVLSLKTVYYA